jgi:hypothetical protein
MLALFYSKKDYMLGIFLFLRLLNPMVFDIEQRILNPYVLKRPTNINNYGEKFYLISGFSFLNFDSIMVLAVLDSGGLKL